MFTGIVEETGEVVDVGNEAEGRRVRVEADLDDLDHGQSIAVNGVCLTVEEHGEDAGSDDPARRETGSAGRWFEVFLSRETVSRTYLGDLRPGDPVNVERALPADGRLDGHIVQGHVDATAEVTAIEAVGDDWEFRFSIPDGLERYLVEKGSVTVDGISLTVADLEDGGRNDSDAADVSGERAGEFGVAIIPATYEITTLSEKSVGDPVHVEADVVAKYVERLLRADGDPAASQTPYAERFERE